MTRIDERLVIEVKDRADVAQVVGRHVKLKRSGRGEFTGLCPFHHEKTGSFTVVPAKGFFHCFGCGAHGDAVGFTMRFLQVDYPTAVQNLASELGIVVGPAAAIDPAVAAQRAAEREAAAEKRRKEERAERDDAIQWCRGIWDSARGLSPHLVLRYLQGRGVKLAALPPTIRCLPRARHQESGRTMPCMVAAIQDVEGRVVGIHRTFLQGDGSAKTDARPAKKMNGQAWGGAVRLAAPAPILVLGEGIETVMSAQLALHDKPGHCFWAGLSLGNLAGRGQGWGGLHPTRVDQRGRPVELPSRRPDVEHPGIVLPTWAREVILLADADNGDPASAEALLARAANRFLAQGRKVRIARPPEGTDFNDALRGAA